MFPKTFLGERKQDRKGESRKKEIKERIENIKAECKYLLVTNWQHGILRIEGFNSIMKKKKQKNQFKTIFKSIASGEKAIEWLGATQA